MDENYNLPLLSSITSLLENLKNEVSIYVIHESKDTFVYKELLLERYSNLINFEIFQFDKNISNFETISSKFLLNRWII